MKTTFFTNAFIALSLPFMVSSAPTVLPRSTEITAKQITTIAPQSSSCANAPVQGQCATAAQAAKRISNSFKTYKVTNAAEQAAAISLMALESGQFKYNKNLGGVAGKGTRNMQSAAFNAKYASSISALSSKLSGASSDPNQVLELLLSNEDYDFGSAAWFLTTQCSKSVRSSLQAGTEAGWEQYITSCVGTTVTSDRKQFWQRAMKALGAN